MRPTIVVYAGRRPDPDDPAARSRFPLANAAGVKKTLERILADWRPATVVGAAACGADLLVLEAAAIHGIRRRVVLPFDRATFRATSVVDRPGQWGPRFDALIAEVSRRNDLIELSFDPAAEDVYQRANAEIFREAETLAGPAGTGFGALVVWDGASRGAGDVTESFLHEVTHRGWSVADVNTLNPALEHLS